MSRLVRVCTALIAICFAVIVHAQDFDEVKRKAKKGDVEAQYDLGVMYAEGQGVAQNYAEAMKWVKKAAKKGNAEAQYKLGWMYAAGKGVSRNPGKAEKWYRKAADQGHAAARKIHEIYPAYLYTNSYGIEMDVLKELLLFPLLPVILFIACMAYVYFKRERRAIERGDVRGEVYARKPESEF
ncbi:MAG: sel1 repeat family protein [Syntrophorhabdaceae bacterium]|nr:sel1 repeat family protein [Syntrophorhabdaceae bacterium]